MAMKRLANTDTSASTRPAISPTHQERGDRGHGGDRRILAADGQRRVEAQPSPAGGDADQDQHDRGLANGAVDGHALAADGEAFEVGRTQQRIAGCHDETLIERKMSEMCGL
jgi:hypothetical protein